MSPEPVVTSPPPDRELVENPVDRFRRWALRPAPVLAAWWSARQPWVQVLLLFVASRLVDALILTRVARFQVASIWTVHQPGYFGFVSLWDGEWYRSIAEDGYPSTIPRDGAGVVQQNGWAFYPLFPYLSRLVMRLFGTGWPVASSIVALGCAALAVVIMRSLLEPLVGRSLAMWSVALFLAFPSAPVLQLAYSESLSVLLLVAALWALQKERYLLLSVVVLLAGLARPIAVPLAAVVGLHLVRRLWRMWRPGPADRDGRATSSGTVTRPWSLVGLGLAVIASGVASMLWPVIAWVVTGERNAYLETMGAWRGQVSRIPLYPWWLNTRFLLGEWIGPILLMLLLFGFLWWITGSRARLIAGDLRAWVLCYAGYLLFVLDPTTSLLRYLLLLFPLGTLLAAASESKAYRRSLVVFFLLGQVVWVSWLWRYVPLYDWPP